MVEYRNIPYVKTTNLAKIIDFFKEEDIVSLRAERRIMEASGKKKPLSYLTIWNTNIRGFYLSAGAKTGRIKKGEIKNALTEYSDGTATVTSIVQYIAKPPALLQKEMETSLQTSYLATGREGIYVFWQNFLIGLQGNEDTKFVQNLLEMNLEESEKKGFKLSVLDCVEIKTYQQFITKDRDGYDPTHYQTGELSKEIRQTLRADKEWHSNRGYIATKEKGWKLISW